MSTPARKYHQSMVHYIRADITYSDATVTIGKLPSGAVITGTKVLITTAFDGTSPSLTVGDGSTADKYVAAGDVTETSTGLTSVSKGEKLSADTSVVATFNQPADTTAGAATIIVEYAPDNG